MKAPQFWNHGENSIYAVCLSPFASLYNAITTRRANKPASFKAAMPVLCVGNLIMGGAGKTPAAISLAQLLIDAGKRPVFLSRGYGGKLSGPVMVEDQPAYDVGDEPRLLRQIAPVCISADRVAGAKLCMEQDADIIIMDDGFQNPHLHKDVSLLVIDGAFGHGNEKTFPAGPLRETLKNGLKRANGVILIGEDKTGTIQHIQQITPTLPILQAFIKPSDTPDIQGQKLVAFAGIARPEKFFETVKDLGGIITAQKSFPDHHSFSDAELDTLQILADTNDARLITTEKDWVRLPEEMRKNVDVIKITLAWDAPDMVKPVLSSLLI